MRTDKHYTLRLTAEEFRFIFTCVFGHTNNARRRFPEHVRNGVEWAVLDAYGPTRDSGLGTVQCEPGFVHSVAVKPDCGAAGAPPKEGSEP